MQRDEQVFCIGYNNSRESGVKSYKRCYRENRVSTKKGWKTQQKNRKLWQILESFQYEEIRTAFTHEPQSENLMDYD